MPWVRDDLCVNCGKCIESCPSGAISMKGGKALVSQEKCIKCGTCMPVCPEGAIRPNSENPALAGRSGAGYGFGQGMGRLRK